MSRFSTPPSSYRRRLSRNNRKTPYTFKQNGKPVNTVNTIKIHFILDSSIPIRDPEISLYTDVPLESDYIRGMPSGDTASSHSLPDSTVFHVFQRNPDWNNMLVVCDFTGSMSPYTAQLLVWHKLI
ncbi:MAG: hypothetical protein AAF587_29900 [Bacteroidota bacterium]